MKYKKFFIGFLFCAIVGGIINSNNSDKTVFKEDTNPNTIATCDGIDVTTDCELDGVLYSVYKYYPPVPEQSHIETITTYVNEIIGYCTKCNDGSYSPSCATGRGACSHHGGVQQFNAPIYGQVPKYDKKKVITKEAEPERWEKILK